VQQQGGPTNSGRQQGGPTHPGDAVRDINPGDAVRDINPGMQQESLITPGCSRRV